MDKVDNCRCCGASILWIRRESGKWQPIDAEPSANGTVLHNGQWYMPHHATCPDVDRFRSKK